MTRGRVRSATATPVVVPARPGSVNSPGIVDQDAVFAAKKHAGSQWTEFANQMKWIVQLETDDGHVGIGESYRGPARDVVGQSLARLVGCDIFQLNWQQLPEPNLRLYDAVESAVLDLAGQIMGVPIYQILGGAWRSRVECSGWTGRRTPADLASVALEALRRGHRVLKFKASDEDKIADLAAAVQSVCGNEIRLLIDPNERWHDAETTSRLMEDVDAAIMFGLEDPVDHADLEGLRKVHDDLGIPVFRHLALPYGERESEVIEAIAAKAIDGLNVNGPMLRFVHVASVADAAGLACWHGSEVDLGILEAAALHACAAAQACTMPSDIFGELVRADDLIVKPITISGGFADVPTAPGLGVELDHEALHTYRCGPTLTAVAR